LEYILVLLIVALLNGAIAYIDGLMEGIVPLTLYAEQYMSTLAGVDLFEALFDIVFGFGVSLIILKFLKKGFETYVLWSDGDADEEPIALLTNFFKAMAVAVCFPTMYGWLAGIVEEMSDKMPCHRLRLGGLGVRHLHTRPCDCYLWAGVRYRVLYPLLPVPYAGAGDSDFAGRDAPGLRGPDRQ